MKHEHCDTEIITQKGTDTICTVSMGEYMWVSFGNIGGSGLHIDNDEWDGFTALVKRADVYVQENRARIKQAGEQDAT